MPDIKVISLGGSIIAPDGVDVPFLKRWRDAILRYLAQDDERRLIVVCGGGRICRDYQAAYRQIAEPADDVAADWVGISTTRANAELVRQILAPHCPDPVVHDPTVVTLFTGRVLVAGGWKPGFSTDYDAVVLAERFSAPTVLNLSNIDYVYSGDPRTDPGARPLTEMSWDRVLELVGTVWKPGLNAPFDPVAAQRARAAGLTCVVAAGREIDNTMAILTGRPYRGTTIRG